MAKPNSRATLISYCKRALGHPVIEINVDDDQVDDRIDEAFQFYQEYHSDAIYKDYLKHQVTQTDVNNEYIDIPDAITTVQRIFPLDDENSTINMFDVKYQIHLNDMYSLRSGTAITTYYQTQQYLRTLDLILNGMEHVRFNRHLNRLYIDCDWENELKVGNYVIVECYRIVDPTTFTDVFNDMFLKRYLTALIKLQWGMNLSKFEGMQLPGGVTISGRQIMEDAKSEIEKIEEEMQLKYEQPPNFYMG